VKIFEFSSGEVLKVELVSLKGHFLFQKNPDGKWMVQNIPRDTASAPLSVLADLREVETIIQKISDLRPSRVVDEKGDDLKSFGFAGPERSAAVTLKNNSVLKLRIGDDGALSRTLYVKREDAGKVYLAGSEIRSIIEKDFWELRNKHLMSFDQGLIDQIEVTAPGKSWSLARKGEEWTLGDRPKDKIDEAKVSSFLFQAGTLEGEKILDEEAKNLKEYGLDKPVVSLSFHSKEKTYTLLIGKTKRPEPDHEELAALGNPSGPVYQIKKEFLDKIPAKEDILKKEEPAKPEKLPLPSQKNKK
ncbi:MAG: DUF4340 domain-containing protein, partial [Nitrospiria bacterium]